MFRMRTARGIPRRLAYCRNERPQALYDRVSPACLPSGMNITGKKQRERVGALFLRFVGEFAHWRGVLSCAVCGEVEQGGNHAKELQTSYSE